MTTQVANELVAAIQSTAEQLQRIDSAALREKPSADKWSVQEVLGHLIDSAANNHHRFVRAQQSPHLSFPDFEQEEWVTHQHYGEAPWSEMVDLWRSYNLHLAHLIRHIPDERLNTPCQIGDNEPVALQDLIEDYLMHMQHHLQKIADRVSAGADAAANR